MSLPAFRIGTVSPSPWMDVRGSKVTRPVDVSTFYPTGENAVTFSTGLTWLILGRANTESQIWEFDPVKGIWAITEYSLPKPLTGSSAVLVNDSTLVIIGGTDSVGATSGNVYSLDIPTKVWTLRGSLIGGVNSVSGYSELMDNGLIMHIEGSSGSGPQAFSINPTTWDFGFLTPPPTGGASYTNLVGMSSGVRLENGKMFLPSMSGTTNRVAVARIYTRTTDSWVIQRMYIPTLTDKGILAFPPHKGKVLLAADAGLYEYSETSGSVKPLARTLPFIPRFLGAKAVSKDNLRWSLSNMSLVQIGSIAPSTPDPQGTLCLDFRDNQYYSGTDGDPESKAFSDLATITRASTAYYYNQNGYLQLAAANQLRLDHDPETLIPKGLLIEESRTNLFTESANPVGSVVGLTVTNSTAVIQPTGTSLSAPRYVVSNVDSEHSIGDRQVGVTAGRVYTCSAYIQRTAGMRPVLDRRVQLSVYGAAVASLNVSMAQASPGSILTPGGATTAFGKKQLYKANPSDIADFTGWLRVWFTFTAASTGTLNFKVNITDGLTLSYPGGTESLDRFSFWGFQCEAGDFPTSLIQTTADVQTRAGDHVDVVIGAWRDDTKGTIVVLGDRQTDYIGTGTAVQMAGASHHDSISIQENTGNVNVRVGNVSQASLFRPVPPVDTKFKHAFSYEVNNFAAAMNGSAVVTDTAGALPVTSNLRLGRGVQSGQSAGFLNGHIARLDYFPHVMPDLTALSTYVD